MTRQIRFGAYLQASAAHEQQLSYNVLAPRIGTDELGGELPYRPSRLRLRTIDIYRLLQPYVSVRLREQVKAVVPLAVYLFIFQLIILRQEIVDAGVIAAGLLAVIIGLMLFMEGLKVGLMPFGETIGNVLPTRSPLPLVVVIAFLLGVGATLAEPAIGALQAAGATINVSEAPYLYALLNDWTDSLVLVIGTGVGIAAVLGTLRFVHGWSLKPLIFIAVIPTLGLTWFLMGDPDLNRIIGVAWDSGGITTGPVTVPLVIALGIGISAAVGNGRSSLAGFGIVTLASLFPVTGVLILGMIIAEVQSPQEIIDAAASLSGADALSWFERTPWVEIILGLRAIVPLIIFLLAVMHFVLHERIRHRGQTIYGLSLCAIGMIVFNLGLSFGLTKLGGQSGGMVAASFTQIAPVSGSPLYSFVLGIAIAGLFAWFLGFLATLAEPALNALGMTVENLTNGAFRKSLLMYAVSIGVATGIGIGVLKIVFDLPLGWILIPGYVVALILTALCNEEFVDIAWDSAGVTTGPVTVPLVLAMGLGFGDAVGAVEGFGILALASLCPILSMLSTGVWVQWRIRRRHELEDTELSAAETATP
ncbi:MAG: DUF1538 domain-containing protein [Gammaproteobacteria bacterium]|nr:DUF1538 domain-containing protein [Gammaproteobacteria bacterium]